MNFEHQHLNVPAFFAIMRVALVVRWLMTVSVPLRTRASIERYVRVKRDAEVKGEPSIKEEE